MLVGTFAGNGPWSAANAGIYLHSGGAGVVPVMDFQENVQVYQG